MPYFEDYKDTIEWMFQQLPMYQRKGKQAFKKNLTNIIALSDHLGNPQNNFRSIHIAGTNGKGSVSHILAAMLQSNGLKVGMYTSPHYLDFRERIKINGEFISKQYVLDFINDEQYIISKIRPSFFEITVAMAFKYFSDQEVDVAIIETGLGGRLDSTNIINPELSIISNISFDHEAMLGDTLAKIAYEKAGIIKKSVTVIIGEKNVQCDQVFIDKARELSSPLYFAQEEIEVKCGEKKDEYKLFWPKSNTIEIIKTDIKGPFQNLNLITAISAFRYLTNSNKILQNITWHKAIIGLNQIHSLTAYMGRWIILDDHPMIIGDSAHNLAGLEIVLKAITGMKYTVLHIVLGMVNDKNIDKILNIFPKNATYYFSRPDIPRGLDGGILKQQANEIGMKGDSFLNLKMAYDSAIKNAQKDDLIFFGGSTFVVSEVLGFTNNT